MRSLWDLRGRHTGGHKIHGSIVHKREKASSLFVTMLMGTLWCSIKKIKAPYVFDWVYGMAVHAMQGGGCLMGFIELRQ